MRFRNVRSFFSVFFIAPCGMIHTSEVQSRCFPKSRAVHGAMPTVYAGADEMNV